MTEQQIETLEGLVNGGMFKGGMLVFAIMPDKSVHSALVMKETDEHYPLFEHLKFLLHNEIIELSEEDDDDESFSPL